jgi:predicted membrane channel-forming protein YqfA (hemolysin III family)
MRINTFVSFVGFVMLIAATYCPILRPFHLRSMDVYDGNKPYGMVILLVAVVGIVGTVFNQVKITRLAAWLSLVLVVLFYILAQIRIHTSFSFIPFHSIDAFLSGQIKLRWGWYLLFAGPLLALAGVFAGKNRVLNKQAS